MKSDVDAAKVLQDKVLAEDKDIDTLQREVIQGQTYQAGLPVTFRDPNGNVHLRGHDAQIVQQATAHEIQNFAVPPSRVCGSCKFFNLHNGRRELVKQRFAERLIADEHWKLHHLGAPLDHMGLCDASGGQLATSTVSNADTCDQYKPKSRTFDR